MADLGQRDILITFAKLFSKFRIPFLLSGSLAGSSYGHPRATHDIDFVLELSSKSFRLLEPALGSLGKEYFQDVSELKKQDADLYTIYHFETGLKIDLWFDKKSDFSNKWKRKKEVRIGKELVYLVSAEDLMLTKLSWCKEVMSDRHMRDCVGIGQVQKGKLNKQYLFTRAEKLGVLDLLSQVMKGKY